MFIELASMLSLVDLVIVGDALVRRKLVTREDLVAGCRDSADRHAAAALTAADFVRAEVDSPMETRLRMLLVLAGLPEPQVNFRVRDAHGDVIRRFDLCYPASRLIVEYDGRQHAEDPDQYESDIYRREQLDTWRWRIVVVTAKGIFHRPEETLLRMRTALREQGARGLPSRFDDAWRAHFPAQQPLRRTS
jgi:very-short-patch-repair endonuclease